MKLRRAGNFRNLDAADADDAAGQRECYSQCPFEWVLDLGMLGKKEQHSGRVFGSGRKVKEQHAPKTTGNGGTQAGQPGDACCCAFICKSARY